MFYLCYWTEDDNVSGKYKGGEIGISEKEQEAIGSQIMGGRSVSGKLRIILNLLLCVSSWKLSKGYKRQFTKATGTKSV